MPYKDRLMHLMLPALKCRWLHRHMIKVFNMTHNTYDPEVSPSLKYYRKSNTGDNEYKLLKSCISLWYTKIFFLCPYSYYLEQLALLM